MIDSPLISEVAAPPPSSAASTLAAAIGDTPSPATGDKAGLPGLTMVDGWVKSIAASPPSLGVSIGGGTAVISGVAYNPAFSPRIGAKVKILMAGTTDMYVLGGETGVSGGGGGVPIGALIGLSYVSTDPSWLYCNGAGFSATTYPELAKIYPGLVLPNLVDRILMGAGSYVAVGGLAGSAATLLQHSHSHSHGPPSQGAHSHSEQAPKGLNAIYQGSGGFIGYTTAEQGATTSSNYATLGNTGSDATLAGNSVNSLPPVFGTLIHVRSG